jgi:hypothetical protein
MDALVAIALLCQTTASGVGRNLTDTYNFQLECQKQYAKCYFGKDTGVLTNAQKLLYECVLEKKPSKAE